MIISRRRLFTAGHAALVTGAVGVPYIARAQQAEFTYKYAHNVPPSHPMHVQAQEAAAAIKAETNGRFELKIFPANQLGSNTGLARPVESRRDRILHSVRPNPYDFSSRPRPSAG